MSNNKDSDFEENTSLPLKHFLPEFELADDLLTKIKTREGFVVFAASLSNIVDVKGNRMIDFDYIRYHFSQDDIRLALDKFKAAIAKDLLEQIGLTPI